MNASIGQIIGEMTLEEKMSLLAGVDMWHSEAIERLAVPALKVTDGPNGARGMGGIAGKASASFPVGIAMGATWNTELIGRVGQALAEETKAKGAHILLGPTVNIHRTPIAGRNFECFSEDPYLTQQIAISYIEKLQAEGVGACVKHYVCNDQEYERYFASSEVSERALREIYLLPFEGAVSEANTWTIMSAYNRINGTWASEHDGLLIDILKKEWQFDGLVISDWYGTYTEKVATSGLDIEMPGPARWMSKAHVEKALEAGEIDTAHIDDKVRRLLLTLERTAASESGNAKEQAIDNPAHRKLIREVGGEAIVLLKNENDLLPLDVPAGGTLAVIGVNAKSIQFQGGGSSVVKPHYVVSPWDALKERAADKFNIEYAVGTPIHRQPPVLSGVALKSSDGKTSVLKAEFFDNLTLAGEPIHIDYFGSTELGMFGQVGDNYDPAHFSLRISGEFTVAQSGTYELSFSVVGASGKLLIDDQSVVELTNVDLVNGSIPEGLKFATERQFEAGRSYKLQMEYVTLSDIQWRAIRLGAYQLDQADPIEEAVALARKADKVLIVAGINQEWEAEGFDRVDMRLPKRQNEMIEKVAAVNANVVVAVNVGSPVEMPWIDQVSAVMHMWYLGQESGNALADVLFGDVNPSGKLPTTFPKKLEDNPTFINYPGENGRIQYGEGLFVGYRYYDKKKLEPLFPFGHGLSYTRFGYQDLTTPAVVKAGDVVQVAFQVQNLGDRTGKEVVQLYVRDIETSLVRPEKELKAFAKILLAPGESRTVEFELSERAFAFYDDEKAAWIVEPGQFEIMIGSSAQNVHLKSILEIED